LAGGFVVSANAGIVPPGARKVTLAIRPEKICLTVGQADVAGTVPAHVEAIVFQGATSRLVLAAGADLRLVALVANESALRSALAVGDNVACALHPEDLVVVGWE
jgi:ABC-type Fe3+/spermidine/putrescine transport system ATPase subunit